MGRIVRLGDRLLKPPIGKGTVDVLDVDAAIFTNISAVAQDWWSTAPLDLTPPVEPKVEPLTYLPAGLAPGAQAEAFLRHHLANGPQSAKAVERAAQHLGIAVRTLQRAKIKLGVLSERTGKGWCWRLDPAMTP
jgi:hypothetical protein